MTREVGNGVIEAAKLRQDGCTGVIVFVTFTTVGFPEEATSVYGCEAGLVLQSVSPSGHFHDG